MNNIPIILKSGYLEYVLCPRVNRRISTNVCKKCDFLRISLIDIVKCTWSPEEEDKRKVKHNYLPESYGI